LHSNKNMLLDKFIPMHQIQFLVQELDFVEVK